MYRLLIVDDEIHAVSAVQSGVDWAKLSISEVYVAYSAKQAKEVFANHEIDLMICDIEMPQGNGLDLLTWVREQFRSTETVFLTCHSDFSYAKKALQLGSVDYMLKPVRYSELEDVLQKAIDRIREKREQLAFNETYSHYFKLWSMHQPILIERFWQDLLNQTIPSKMQQIREALLQQNIPYREDDPFLPILINVQRWHKEFTLRDEKIMEYALRNAAEDLILKHYPHGQIVQTRKGALIVQLAAGGPNAIDIEQLQRHCESYIASCHRYFYCDLSCYIGTPGFLWEMVDRYEALLGMEKNNVTQNNKVLFLKANARSYGHIDLIQMNGWLELLKQGAEQAIFTETENYLNSWKQLEGLDARMLQEFCQSFLQILYHFIQIKGLQAHQVLAENMSPERIAAAIRSVTELQGWVQDSLQKTFAHTRSAEETQSVVDKVKLYIKQNLDQNVSRDDIVKHIHLHPDYLSRMFKKETGKSIVDYIFEERIEIAKQLLAKTNMSVSEVAVSVGYTNFSYFAKMFKKATQKSPQAFRETPQ
ncbi:response regulator [Paenibacillus thalictri]|uniref:Response regulator n=1 Tax=Paenibacillus thalictri TaxID=2527873 RepID=A0A4Q9DXE1_9BACL|nr:response regulator [Paenibacillus thalictri]TBL79901.1 response regulator [Paenibacillus thalictri]